MLEEYGEATFSRFACASTLQKCEEWDAELMHVVDKSAKKKGRRDAEDAEDAEAYVVGSVITLPLVVALVIALSFEAIRQLPSASVYDHKKAETWGLCMWWLKVRKRDAEN